MGTRVEVGAKDAGHVAVGSIVGVGVEVALGGGLLVGVGNGVASGSGLLVGVGADVSVEVSVGSALLAGVGANVGSDVGAGREVATLPKTGELANFWAETASIVR